MKFKTTKREMMQTCQCVRLGYCEAQFILRVVDPQAYTCGTYGWNADVYLYGSKAIVTGYRPFGREPKLSYEEIKRRDNEASMVMSDATIPYDKRREILDRIYSKFMKEV